MSKPWSRSVSRAKFQEALAAWKELDPSGRDKVVNVLRELSEAARVAVKVLQAATEDRTRAEMEESGRVQCRVCGGWFKMKHNGLPRGHAGPEGSYCRSPREE